MGVIAGVIAVGDRDDETESTPRDRDGESPYLSPELTDSLDPFLTGFDTSQVRVTDRELQLILGLLIVVSNLLGD